ncbi:carboxypeptidase regulatory-like domain-containing protein [uncultured Lacinutrix sp.]|uniref:carboxypeptidase regulatory-like domain-containing protein n=1 Tax=uncultured Lacinutrix sp. TaxID=574032 RepID=UPI00261384F4|nr:carboxypeptidase regulatory-like domain-containing protein [uncultured Lacinutrix sp.]
MKTIKNIVLFFATILFFTACSENQIDGVKVGSINGKVVSEGTNTPLENVKISTNPSSSTTFTDDEGNFVLNNVEVQTYSVQAELGGYVTSFESATVIEDAAATVAFELITSNANNQPPTTPNLVFPEDLSTEVSLDVEFTWEASDPDSNDELTYVLELRNGITNDVELFETAQDTFYLATNLELSTTYFWQVKVSDGINDEVVSPVSQFTTITVPDNPLVFVKEENGNSVIYSGKKSTNDGTGIIIDVDLLKLTSETNNSFRPRANTTLNKIAYFRTVGGNTHLFVMNSDGSNKTQATSSIPVAGFRADHLDFCWAQNGSKLYYPNFDKLYQINPNGSGVSQIYQTTDGSFISEVQETLLDSDLLLLKTNTSDGYNARIFTVRLSTGMEETVVVENLSGALGGIDITANGNEIVYTRDVSGSENANYRQFESRIFLFDVASLVSTQLPSGTVSGENDLDVKYSPDEGSLIFTRVLNNISAIPIVMTYQFGVSNEESQQFSAGSMPDWD